MDIAFHRLEGRCVADEGLAAASDACLRPPLRITKVGTTVVDIFDSQTKQLLWRGKETSDLGNNNQKNISSLAKDTADLFKHFPPTH